ncbi:hypothetical protein [Actinokineospora sp. HUAS TT18]|uniref:hypothetical protein n=1 Tax=Actinokineospora sp. HUAS TT18 TaxID=3447451 RepID=UPI003F5254AA
MVEIAPQVWPGLAVTRGPVLSTFAHPPAGGAGVDVVGAAVVVDAVVVGGTVVVVTVGEAVVVVPVGPDEHGQMVTGTTVVAVGGATFA